MKEIGSEFWKIDLDNHNNNLDFLKIGMDQKLLMSGRTAIDFVLGDFNDVKKIVYMPDYCCESMVKPFIDNEYSIIYYHVDLESGTYDIDKEINCSIFFAMNYFGYKTSNMDEFISSFSKRNVIVIEDITHRLMSTTNYCQKSDYLIGSLRKWFPIISGGVAIKVSSKFNNSIDNYIVDESFVNTKLKAMEIKKKYMEGYIDSKDEFLQLYKDSNECFLNYKNKKIDNISLNILKSIDINKIRLRRISNCLLIEKKLNNNKKIKLLFRYTNGDCPLFVPVLIENRNEIRRRLIEKRIYLPVHWPNNDLDNKIYNMEISLINDQRYLEKDIEQYIYELVKIVGE